MQQSYAWQQATAANNIVQLQQPHAPRGHAATMGPPHGVRMQGKPDKRVMLSTDNRQTVSLSFAQVRRLAETNTFAPDPRFDKSQLGGLYSYLCPGMGAGVRAANIRWDQMGSGTRGCTGLG